MSTAVGTESTFSSRPKETGFTRITRTALNRVLAVVAAEAFALDPRTVKAESYDKDGRLAVTVNVPVQIPSLLEIAKDADVLAQTGGTIAERADLIRETVVSRGSALAGMDIASVDILIANAVIEPRKAVVQ